MLALSTGLGERGEGPTAEVASTLPAVESGACGGGGGGEALEGAKWGEGGRKIVGREE